MTSVKGEGEVEVDWKLKYETLQRRINGEMHNARRHGDITLCIAVLWYFFGHLIVSEDSRMWMPIFFVFACRGLAWKSTAMEINQQILCKEEKANK
jgi:hypothetical protein